MSTVTDPHPQPVKYAVMRYASEKDNAGKQNAGTWPQIAGMLQKRDIRQRKSGKAFSPVTMKPGSTRAKDNVLSISMAVADIDTEGNKDKQTGQLLSVAKRAPPLSQLRPNIERYAWAAHSSHWHEPERLGASSSIGSPFRFHAPARRRSGPLSGMV